jgi:hypothetical protein
MLVKHTRGGSVTGHWAVYSKSVKKNVEFKFFKLYSNVYFKAKLHPANKWAFFYHIRVNLCGIAQSKNSCFFVEVGGIV